MRKSTSIKIVIHPPPDRDAFEKLYIEASLEALKQLAKTAHKPKDDNRNNDSNDTPAA